MTDRQSERPEPYKRTPTFTEASIPLGLLQDHATKEGTWGLITVERGELRYFVTDHRRPASETIVTPAAPALVEPTILHRVEPAGEVRFHVAFYRYEPFPDKRRADNYAFGVGWHPVA